MSGDAILTFACPACHKTTKFYEKQKPIGQSKQCKGCQQRFILSKATLVSLTSSAAPQGQNQLSSIPSSSFTSVQVPSSPFTSVQIPSSSPFTSVQVPPSSFTSAQAPSSPPTDFSSSISLDSIDLTFTLSEEAEAPSMPKKTKKLNFFFSIQRDICSFFSWVFLSVARIFSKPVAIITIAIVAFLLAYEYKRRPFRSFINEKYSITSYSGWKPSHKFSKPAKGKVLVIEYNLEKYTASLDNRTFNLPENLQPQKMEDVKTIALIYKSKNFVMNYRCYKFKKFGKPQLIVGYNYRYTVLIIDRETRGLIAEKVFDPGFPQHIDTYYGQKEITFDLANDSVLTKFIASEIK